MTEYAAEQEMELEALQAILMDDLQELKDVPGSWPEDTTGYRVAIRVDDELAEGGGGHAKQMDLIFAHTPNYPDEAPLAKISSVQGLSSAEVDQVNNLIEEQITSNLGMAMIYTIVGALKEWLIDQVAGANETGFEVDPKELERRQQEAEEQRLAEARAHGTPVTVDTFLTWKRKFDAEKQQLLAQTEPDIANKDKGPTGRAFFLAQDAGGDQAEEEQGSEESDYDDLDEEEDEEDDEEDDENDLIEELLLRKQQS